VQVAQSRGGRYGTTTVCGGVGALAPQAFRAVTVTV
jgi:hypothetical protein